MPFADAAFDAVVSQESWCHIPGKRSLIAECVRVARPQGVIAFTDIVSLAPMDPEEERRLLAKMFIPRPSFVTEYTQLLTEGSCIVEQTVELSDEWKGILVASLEMYRSCLSGCFPSSHRSHDRADDLRRALQLWAPTEVVWKTQLGTNRISMV